MRKLAVLLTLALAATAFAQTDTDSSFAVTATKPAGVVTIAFQDPAGTALVSPMDLGAFTVDETKEIATVLFADYSNLGEDSDNWSVVFAADAQTGYSYQVRVDTNDGANVVQGTAQALSSPIVNTVSAYGDSSGYVEANNATALGAAAADADQFIFLINAGSTVEADLSTTITATLTYQ